MFYLNTEDVLELYSLHVGPSEALNRSDLLESAVALPQEGKMTMAIHAKSKAQVAEALLADDRPEDIEQAEIVHGGSRVNAPTSIRLNAPLLEAIDRLATQEHRKRGNTALSRRP